jgi:hypothetical protein
MGVAVSLLKRAREIVLGVPALLWWQGVEGRIALHQAQERVQWPAASEKRPGPKQAAGPEAPHA